MKKKKAFDAERIFAELIDQEGEYLEASWIYT